MKSRSRAWILAGYFLVGAIVTQWGACWIIGANTLIPGVAQNWVDTDGKLFGLVNVCGIPDVLVVGTGTTAGTGTIQFTEDDLVTVCPVTVITP